MRDLNTKLNYNIFCMLFIKRLPGQVNSKSGIPGNQITWSGDSIIAAREVSGLINIIITIFYLIFQIVLSNF